MLSAALLPLSFCCVAHLYTWNSIQQLMIRINADERSVAILVEQTCLPAGRDVKEDLKRIQFHPLKKYQSNQIVREQQIYGLTRICGNKAVTLPVRMDEHKR